VTPQRRSPYKRAPRSLRLRAYLAMSRLRRRSITMQGSSLPTLTMSRYASMPPREGPSVTNKRHFVSLAHRPAVWLTDSRARLETLAELQKREVPPAGFEPATPALGEPAGPPSHGPERCCELAI
jgi:hypothetical protein